MEDLGKIDFQNIFDKVKANHMKLHACPRHVFPAGGYVFGQKLTCVACGGEMRAEAISWYIDGYEAAGGSADDVWPGYRKRKTPDAPETEG